MDEPTTAWVIFLAIPLGIGFVVNFLFAVAGFDRVGYVCQLIAILALVFAPDIGLSAFVTLPAVTASMAPSYAVGALMGLGLGSKMSGF